MARTGDFQRVNLLILPADQLDSVAEALLGRTKAQHPFADENRVIDYLAEGKTIDSPTNTAGFYVLVLEPADDTGGLASPEESSLPR